jgi:hypothetical protein
MPIVKSPLALAAVVLTLSSVARADPIFGTNDPSGDRAATPEARERADHFRPGFGARVGGYGFRRSDGSSEVWDDCRMNGFGVFGTLDLNPTFFGELSADFYNAQASVVQSGMDRVSTHGLMAIGARMFPDFVVTPFVQVGGGAEWTRVETTEMRHDGVYPMGFIGLGAELNVTRELKLGGTFRVLATTRPERATIGGSASGSLGLTRQALTSGDGDQASLGFGLAAQGQFFARYAL